MKTTPGSFVRSYAAQLALTFAVIFITGCLSRPPLIKESFAFPIPAAAETPTNSATGSCRFAWFESLRHSIINRSSIEPDRILMSAILMPDFLRYQRMFYERHCALN